ncbi:hypothetical protein [uncultured Tolumonas sp.]|uniref:hypothetical protein n=1 Tax=uncultured Tolumonas sp. TaxID=263765 RepID=UPI002A0A3BC5|nr:hypothetical protein [uncultured Tolumonas sp.]
MLRKVISNRIKESKDLKKKLKEIAKSEDKEHQLWVCESCGQTWQSSRAWNWGNDLYLFKVPPVFLDEWLKQPYVQPDELLIYVGGLSEFLKQGFEKGEEKCKKDGCADKTIKGLAICLKHHIESLQKVRLLPQEPVGRWFKPYIEENFKPNL